MKSCCVYLLCLFFSTVLASSPSSKDGLRKSLKPKIKQYIPKKVLDKHWINFKSRYNKTYADANEESRRLTIFAQSLNFILDHNNGGKTFKLQVNQFGDMTPEEVVSRRTGLKSRRVLTSSVQSPVNRTSLGSRIFTSNSLGSPKTTSLSMTSPSSSRLPESVDWRTKGIISKAKDQGSCGSCWAFAVAGAVESFVAKRTGVLTELSAQELVDCVRGGYFISEGCNGGAIEDAFDYVIKNGITSNVEYPYRGYTGPCKSNWFMTGTRIQDYIPVKNLKSPTTENNLLLKRREEILNNKLKAALTAGPVTAAIDAMSPFFTFYKNGILSDSICSNTEPNHAVLVVGYDRDSWIIKNSWGQEWGDKGFARLSMQTPCSLTLSMHQPIL